MWPCFTLGVGAALSSCAPCGEAGHSPSVGLCCTVLYVLTLVYLSFGSFLTKENFKIVSYPLSGRGPDTTSLKDMLVAAAAGDWELGHSGLSTR